MNRSITGEVISSKSELKLLMSIVAGGLYIPIGSDFDFEYSL